MTSAIFRIAAASLLATAVVPSIVADQDADALAQAIARTATDGATLVVIIEPIRNAERAQRLGSLLTREPAVGWLGEHAVAIAVTGSEAKDLFIPLAISHLGFDAANEAMRGSLVLIRDAEVVDVLTDASDADEVHRWLVQGSRLRTSLGDALEESAAAIQRADNNTAARALARYIRLAEHGLLSRAHLRPIFDEAWRLALACAWRSPAPGATAW